MDNIMNDWLLGEAWNCKPPMHDAPSDQGQGVPTPSDSYAQTGSRSIPQIPGKNPDGVRTTIEPQKSNAAGKGPLVLDASTGYQWPRALPPRQLYGYTSGKAFTMLFRVVLNLALVGGLLYATIALAAVKKISIDYDSCLAETASWFESRFFINVVVREGLSFTQAKLIDLAWDTFVGQGLRFLHAWWLYQVTTHVVTYCLETSGLTYDFLLALLFRPDSYSSLIAALRMTFGKNWTNCRLYCMWLAFAIGYILAYPTIWAASTGYANPSITAYNMSDKAYVPIRSDDLTLCWVSNDTRLSGFLDSVIIGPSFSSLYDFDENHVPNPRTPWKLPTDSSTFKDIFFYAKTKHTLQNYFHSFNISGHVSNMTNGLVELPADNNTRTEKWTDPGIHFDEEWDGLFFYQNKTTRDVWESPGFSQVIAGFQFSPNFSSYHDAIFHFNETGTEQHLENGAWVLGPGIVPYNSTLVLENKKLSLPAPFLSFGIGEFDCSWWDSSTGECPCYLGKPLEADWAITDQYSCIGASGYVWGFSSFILAIGVVLEAVWIIGCWVTRWRTTVGSNLIENNRRNIGTVRNLLDLAEAINQDLGPDTSIYTDVELRDALRKCPPVGYELESRGGLKHIGLVTVHHGTRWRRKIDINFDDTYR
ncbi:hypothetical protein ANO14919_072640 [Xylariales sp. No.14919]|nr:hypothetical protein ANO14919_072640 [Xylariales sp. No.14919]